MHSLQIDDFFTDRPPDNQRGMPPCLTLREKIATTPVLANFTHTAFFIYTEINRTICRLAYERVFAKTECQTYTSLQLVLIWLPEVLKPRVSLESLYTQGLILRSLKRVHLPHAKSSLQSTEQEGRRDQSRSIQQDPCIGRVCVHLHE